MEGQVFPRLLGGNAILAILGKLDKTIPMGMPVTERPISPLSPGLRAHRVDHRLSIFVNTEGARLSSARGNAF